MIERKSPDFPEMSHDEKARRVQYTTSALNAAAMMSLEGSSNPHNEEELRDGIDKRLAEVITAVEWLKKSLDDKITAKNALAQDKMSENATQQMPDHAHLEDSVKEVAAS